MASWLRIEGGCGLAALGDRPGGVGHGGGSSTSPLARHPARYGSSRADFRGALLRPRPANPAAMVSASRGHPGTPRAFVRSLPRTTRPLDQTYLDQLDLLDRVTRAQKKLGDWLIKPSRASTLPTTPLVALPRDGPPPRRLAQGRPRLGLRGDRRRGLDRRHPHRTSRRPPSPSRWWTSCASAAPRSAPAGEGGSRGRRPRHGVDPQDPGQAGVDQRDATHAALSASRFARRPTGSKVVARAITPHQVRNTGRWRWCEGLERALDRKRRTSR